ncbi:MAG TPA: hypothetical protein VG714_04810 [Acidobacteriaceae bacterium]|nr:hypothetical protein [Acidobacteriaceae bacterium]
MTMTTKSGAQALLPLSRQTVPSAPASSPRRTFALALTLIALLAPLAASTARAQRIGPPAPVSYDNKYELYGGLNYMNFKAGENLTHRMNLGGAEISGTWWLNPKWGVVADYRGEAGTTQVDQNAHIYGIHHPLVYMNMALFGAQYRGPKNQLAAINYHAYGGFSHGVFDAGTDGAGPGDIYSASENARLVGLYPNKTAALFALGGSLDLNRSKNWAIRLSPDLILEHFGNEEREFFSISGGVVYRFPLRGSKKK